MQFGTAHECRGQELEATLPDRARSRTFVVVLSSLGLMVGTAMVLCASGGPAQALPSYARQTGQPCAICHTVFPELTPYGGRFKISGYTLGGGDWQGPPIAAMYIAGFTHTNSP